MERVHCNLCGGTKWTTLYRDLPDLLLGRRDISATLVKCQECGMVYQNPRPTRIEMLQNYPPTYELYLRPSGLDGGPWMLQLAIKYGIRKRWRFVTRHQQGGRILDIGCAIGTFLQGMRKNPHWALFGLEQNAEAARIAREQFCLQVDAGTLEDTTYASDFFDAVTLWDVLEHLHDPLSSLREIHRILKPAGTLVMRVPNVNSWDAKLFGRFWAGLEAPRHLFIFEPNTLSRLLRTAGFNVIEWSCNSAGYTTFLMSLRFWLGGMGVNVRAREILAALLAHPVMRVLAAPVFYVSGMNLHGPLLTVTASKLKPSNYD